MPDNWKALSKLGPSNLPKKNHEISLAAAARSVLLPFLDVLEGRHRAGDGRTSASPHRIENTETQMGRRPTSSSLFQIVASQRISG